MFGMIGLTTAITAITCLGCALMSGVFFAFSTLVMAALAQLPTRHGIAAMQAINRQALRTLFVAAFAGTAVGCVYLFGSALLAHPAAPMRLVIGSGPYLVGVIGLTIGYQVPRNQRLALMDATDPSRPRSAAATAPVGRR